MGRQSNQGVLRKDNGIMKKKPTTSASHDASEWPTGRRPQGRSPLGKQTDPQDTEDARQREAVLQQTIVDLQKVLFNTAGLDRLANITDEEWAEAEGEDSNV